MSTADTAAMGTAGGVMSLAPGHPARRPFARTLWTAVLTGLAFTVFTYVTTQVHSVRDGSPWQDDPYDGMVSFTEFLVPALIFTMALRGLLVRRRQPLPVFRAFQLLRSVMVCLVLVAATLLVDWIAVVLRADRQLWDRHTPWLIGSLVPLTALTAVGFALHRRATGMLRPVEHGRAEGDWLDDLGALLSMVATPLPGGLRRPIRRVATGPAIGFLRRHIVAAAAALSLLLSLGITTLEAVGEGWDSPLLFATGTAVGFGGFFAFCLVTNVVLLIAVPHSDAPAPDSTSRRAARTAVICGSIALPVSAVFRDHLWSAVSGESSVASIRVFAAIVGVSGVTVALLVFCGMLAVHRRDGSPHPSR